MEKKKTNNLDKKKNISKKEKPAKIIKRRKPKLPTSEYVTTNNPKKQKQELRNIKKLRKNKLNKLKNLKRKYSTKVIKGSIISTTNSKPDLDKNIIELNDVQKSYFLGTKAQAVLKGINLKIPKGEFVVILGPSGSGKTTLLNVISGLDIIDKGDIFVDGYNLSLLTDKDLTKFRRQKIGFVFQQYNLLPHLTAKENAEVGANLNKNKTGKLTIDKIFKMIWMEDHINKFPYQLSGGQQQRVSIARALSKQPAILFCDEPTGALDEETGRIVLDVLVNISNESKTTIIVVTHNPNIAKIAGTIIRIANGQIVSVTKNKNRQDPHEIKWA